MRMRTRGESSEGMGHIKTGRLDDVVSLAGILQSREGVRYALAFIINHHDAHRGIGVDIGDVLIDWLYNYEAGDGI
jgi:D-alanyl-D-alanine carboxypeptidase/D-alanyl-D-alanine-endopeptidase (penicillin-binding protein 4)